MNIAGVGTGFSGIDPVNMTKSNYFHTSCHSGRHLSFVVYSPHRTGHGHIGELT